MRWNVPRTSSNNAWPLLKQHTSLIVSDCTSGLVGNMKTLGLCINKHKQFIEQAEGPNTLSEANSLTYLAALYYEQWKYEQAEPLFQRALAIYERVLGTEHPDTGGKSL